MTQDEIKQKIRDLDRQIYTTKKEVDYYNALQLALKLVLNGSY
jgi:hypothetical protein